MTGTPTHPGPAPHPLAVGVVVPARDAAAHLAGALRSVVSQVPPPTDVVVVDGGSRDDTVAVARSFPGVRVIAQDGTGLAGARNQGVAAVTGSVLAFCDADDRWTDGSLSHRVARLHQRPEVGAVIGRVRPERLPGEPVPAQHLDRLDTTVPGYTPGALAVRRAVLGAVGGFDEALRIGTDSDWFVRLVQSDHEVAVLDEVVLTKGVRATSLSADIDLYRRELLGVARAYVRRHRNRP